MKSKRFKNKAVIVSQRIDKISKRKEIRDSLDQELVKWIAESGYIPFPVPNTLKNTKLITKFINQIQPIGIILSGGNDIGEYNSRDETELFLINFAVQNRIPLIGICRGFQMLAKWDGGDFVRIDGHISKKNKLIINNSNWPDEIICYHKWALLKATPNFTIEAHSADGSIEAIKHKEHPIEGWMWHPERNMLYRSISISRINNLFKKN